MALAPVKVLLAAGDNNVRSRGTVIKLEELGEGIESKWVQVAKVGDFLGYGGPDYPGFTFDHKIFDQVIAKHQAATG